MSSDAAADVAQPPTPVTVVVAHHRDEDRDTMARWLANDDRFSVVGELADVERTGQAVDHLQPDVVLIATDLPATTRDGDRDDARTGIELMAEINLAHPAVRIVAVADHDDDRAYAAVGAGAAGCYLWNDPVAPLIEVVAGVARDEGALTPGWAGRLLDEVGWLQREPSPLRAPELTPTELEVLRRVASGATPAAIAALHGVTRHVVNVHAGIVVTKVFRHHDDTRRLGLAPA